jgi:hypothetical protein
MWKLKRCPHCAGKIGKKDAAIFPIVHQLNLIDGIDTIASCSGHFNQDEAYVLFRCRDYATLKKLTKKLFSSDFDGEPNFHFKFRDIPFVFRIVLEVCLGWKTKELEFKLCIEMPSNESRERILVEIGKQLEWG